VQRSSDVRRGDGYDEFAFGLDLAIVQLGFLEAIALPPLVTAFFDRFGVVGIDGVGLDYLLFPVLAFTTSSFFAASAVLDLVCLTFELLEFLGFPALFIV